MFTGLIEEVGVLRRFEPLAGGRRLVVGCKKVLEGMAVGDSLSINGVCQTVVDVGGEWTAVEAVGDTLAKTTLGLLAPGAPLNLERACRADTRMGGHFVLGHVQRVEKVLTWSDQGAAWNLEVSLDSSIKRYLVAEGSVAVDGVSLTVAELTARGFRVSVIPHTRAVTRLAQMASGDLVNIEVDILAKYVESLMDPGRKGLDLESLKRWGYR